MMSSDAGRRASLAALMVHMAGIGMTLGLLFPLTSLTLLSWGSSDWEIGLAGAMSPVAILLLMPYLPTAVSLLGAVRAMALGCAIAALAIAAMHVFQNVPAWIACRFVIGAGLALPWLTGDVWVNTVAVERSRSKVVGGYVVCFSVGLACGPVLLERVGTDGFGPHAAGIGALLMALLPLLVVARFAPPIAVTRGDGVLDAMRAVPVVAVGALTAGFTESAAFALFPVWALGIGQTETGALRLLSAFVVGGIALQVIIGAVADRAGRRPLLIGVGAALGLVALALHHSSGGAVFVLAFAAGGLVLAIYALSLTLLGQRFAATELAMASAAYLMLYQIGSMSGPLLTGVAMEIFGTGGFVGALGLAGLACSFVALRSERPSA